MKKITYTGFGTMVLGLVGMTGAIDTDYGWKTSLIILFIGLVLAFIGTMAQFWSEINEDYKEYRSIQHGCNNDASYPSFLRK